MGIISIQVKLDLVNFLGSGKKFTKSRGFTKSSVTNFLSSEIDTFVRMDTIGIFAKFFNPKRHFELEF